MAATMTKMDLVKSIRKLENAKRLHEGRPLLTTTEIRSWNKSALVFWHERLINDQPPDIANLLSFPTEAEHDAAHWYENDPEY